MMINIIWLLMNAFTIVIINMDSALHVEYSDAVLCCASVDINNCPTSNNKQLDESIKKSQLQTNSANQPYLEWIPLDCIGDRGYGLYFNLYGLPTSENIKLTPLEITDETHDLYYDKVIIKYSCEYITVTDCLDKY